jgi:hypothetical protein
MATTTLTCQGERHRLWVDPRSGSQRVSITDAQGRVYVDLEGAAVAIDLVPGAWEALWGAPTIGGLSMLLSDRLPEPDRYYEWGRSGPRLPLWELGRLRDWLRHLSREKRP